MGSWRAASCPCNSAGRGTDHDPDRRGCAARRNRSEWKTYPDRAVETFRLGSSGMADATRMQTRMCYSEFNDIIDPNRSDECECDLDRDIHTKMELLDAFKAQATSALA